MASGLVGFAMLLAQFVTSGRFEIISSGIGLDRTMGFHRLAAIGLALLLIFHVVLLAGRASGSLPDLLARLGLYLTRPAMFTGTFALALILLLTVWARWLRSATRYEVWRLVHGLGAVLAALFALHHIWRFSDVTRHPAVWLWYAIMAGAAFLTIFTVYIIRPARAYRLGAAVEKVARLSDSIVEVIVRLPDKTGFSFRAGQFAWLAFAGRHTLTDNPFSIASAPGELPALRFLVREAGDLTRKLISLKPGTQVAIDGPHGSFTVPAGARQLVLVAGGIGIAPILGIFRDLMARPGPLSLRIMVAVRDPGDAIVGQEISALEGSRDVRTILTCDEEPLPPGCEKGPPTRDHVRRLLAGLEPAQTAVLLCGPPGMTEVMAEAFLAEGIPAERIELESFDYDVARDRISARRRRRAVGLIGLVAAVAAAAALASSL
jgi:predicted ferric reductase